MINDFYLTKSDILELESGKAFTISSEVTKTIMSSATDPISLIKAIEKFNDDNKLPLNKRVKYSIGISNVYLPVAKAYEVGSCIAICAYTQSGGTGFKYGEGENSRKLISAKDAVATHLVPKDKITDVVFGTYDPSKVTIFDEPIEDETEDISEKELVKNLTILLNDINSMLSAGMYKSLIKKFNIEFKNKKYNSISYDYKPSAYSIYIALCEKYISACKTIVNEYNMTKEGLNDNIVRKFYFVDETITDANIDSIINNLKEDIPNGRDISNGELAERVFSISDITSIYANILK